MPYISAKRETIYRQIFQKCDTNDNGTISLKELIDFIRTHQWTNHLNDDQIAYILSFDVQNHTELLSYEEFVNIMEKPEFKFIILKWMKRYVNLLLMTKTRHVKITEPYAKATKVQQVALLAPQKLRRSYSREFSYTETYTEAFTCCPPPFAMVLISVLQLVCFITDEIDQPGSTLTGSGVTAQIFIYDPAKRFEAWRFLSYMLVHIGRLEIIVNLAVQLLLGIPLEIVHKWWKVSLIYFAGVVAGSLVISVIDPWSRLAGATGGVYALLTVQIATVIMNWSKMSFPALQLCILGVIISCDIGTSIYIRYYLEVENQVGFAAYFGGALAGLLVGIYILKNLNIKICTVEWMENMYGFEKYVRWFALVLFVILMSTAILLNIFLPHRYPQL